MSDLSLRAGAIIAGRYRLERLLGEGGMAIVWEAMHTVTRRAVAMKFLRESLRGREELRVRFHREASAASALRHPNVVEIIDVFDFEEGAPVMVMELLHGETLGQKLERDEKLSLEETAALVVPVISAVGAAHALGIVHRDLKPENVFLSPGAAGMNVKVLDFGIAKLTTGISPRGLHTEAGSMLGTPCYMAPEQASSNTVVDHRADIWSLGVILYECLSGTRPIEGDDLVQVVNRLVNAAIMPLERLAPELPHDVATMVMQMLSRDPARRPPDLTEVARLLGSYTRAAAPAFGPASAGKSRFPAGGENAQGRVLDATKAQEGKPADPRGPTLLSTPPVPSSVTVIADEASERQRRAHKRWMLMAGGLLAVAALGILWLRFGAATKPEGAPRGGSELASSAVPSPASQPPAATVTPGAMSTTASASAPPAPSQAAKTSARRSRPTPRPAALSGTAARSRPPEELATARPAKDEAELFSGRK
jgi:serine/threonine-protein kinase